MKNQICLLGIAVTLCLGLSACSGGSFFASTPTPTPTSTPTITPSHTPTQTPTPTPTPIPATQLQQNADGTWTFYDYQAGYQFTMPETWYLEDVSALTVAQIFERTNTLRDELSINNVPLFYIQPEGMRVLGVYLDDTIEDYTAVSFSAAHIVSEEFAALPLKTLQKKLVGFVEQNYEVELEDIGSELFVNQHDLEFGIVLYNLVMDYNQMRIFFKTDDGIVIIIFGFSEGNAEAFGPDWALLTGSLEYIKP